MKHQLFVTLQTDIDNRDVEFEVKGNGKVIGTLFLSKGRVEWRAKNKQKSKAVSLTWTEFAALMEGKEVDKTPPYSGKTKAVPAGRPAITPKDLPVRGPMTGGATKGKKVGSGEGLVNVSLQVAGSSRPRKVILPAGLSMVPNSDSYQNGVLVQDVTLDIPANEDESFVLNMYCANKGRKVPGKQVVFSFGPILKSPGLDQLIELLRKKNIGPDATELIQDAVWEVTDGDGLADATRAAIEALPTRRSPRRAGA